jgi:hypothetical protein
MKPQERTEAHNRLWNQLSTSEAKLRYRPYSLWPKTRKKPDHKKPLLVYTTPHGYSMTGTHRS